MGLGVTLVQDYIGVDKFILRFLENNSVKQGESILDKGDGNRRRLGIWTLPSKLDNAGVYTPGVTDESICYNNAVHVNDRHFLELYEFDGSGGRAEEFEFFPGWSVTGKKDIPEYAADFFRLSRKCKFNKINRIPTDVNIRDCCLRNQNHCPPLLGYYVNPHCDKVLVDYCLTNQNIWNKEICKEWIDHQIDRPHYRFYKELESIARKDFKGKGGSLLWTLSFYDPGLRSIYDSLLDEFCQDDNEECNCYNKKNFKEITRLFQKIEAPIECILSECKNTHPRFLSKQARERVKNCRVVNCDISIDSLSGSGILSLNNQCGELNSPVTKKQKTETKYTKTPNSKIYFFSWSWFFLIIPFLWFLFIKLCSL